MRAHAGAAAQSKMAHVAKIGVAHRALMISQALLLVVPLVIIALCVKLFKRFKGAQPCPVNWQRTTFDELMKKGNQATWQTAAPNNQMWKN